MLAKKKNVKDGDWKIRNVHKQINELRAGRRPWIDCPYCKGKSVEPDFCCDTIRECVVAILHREQTVKLMDTAAKIADIASRN